MRVEVLGRRGSSPRTLAKGPSALWTSIRGDHHWVKARLAEGEPGLQGSRRATGAPRRGACEALPIRHGNCRDTFPAGEGTGLVVLGRGSPTFAPLRPVSRVPSQGQEAATSCGVRQRLLLLLRPCTVMENRSIPDLLLCTAWHAAWHTPPVRQAHQPARNEAAHRCRPAASKRVIQHPNTPKPPPRGSD